MRPDLRALLLAALLALPAATPARADVDEAQLAAARERVAEAQRRVEAARGELGGSQRALRDAEKQVATVTTRLREARRREQENSRELARIARERDRLKAEAARQRAALEEDVRQAWMLGRGQQLRLWLSADDPQQAARVSRYFTYFQRDRVQRLAAWEETRAALAASEQRLTEQQAALAALRASLEEREQELRAAGEQRREAVAVLQRELSARSDELARVRADEAELRRLVEAARQAFRAIAPEQPGTPFARRRGQLPWPVDGRVVARFGSPLAEGKLSLRGVLLSAREGSEVRAVHAGRVVYADWVRGYGLLSIIDHGDGYLSVYGHNQALTRNTGDWVRAGEAIATVGNSGGRDRPGLYFEIRAGGEPVDPARWCR